MKRLGRITIDTDGAGWPRPFVNYVNDGPDWHYLGFGITNSNCALVNVEINLGAPDVPVESS